MAALIPALLHARVDESASHPPHLLALGADGLRALPNSTGEEGSRENKLPEHQIKGGWRAASPAGLYGQGSSKRSALFTDTGSALAPR